MVDVPGLSVYRNIWFRLSGQGGVGGGGESSSWLRVKVDPWARGLARLFFPSPTPAGIYLQYIIRTVNRPGRDGVGSISRRDPAMAAGWQNVLSQGREKSQRENKKYA